MFLQSVTLPVQVAMILGFQCWTAALRDAFATSKNSRAHRLGTMHWIIGVIFLFAIGTHPQVQSCEEISCYQTQYPKKTSLCSLLACLSSNFLVGLRARDSQVYVSEARLTWWIDDAGDLTWQDLSRTETSPTGSCLPTGDETIFFFAEILGEWNLMEIICMVRFLLLFPHWCFPQETKTLGLGPRFLFSHVDSELLTRWTFGKIGVSSWWKWCSQLFSKVVDIVWPPPSDSGKWRFIGNP